MATDTLIILYLLFLGGMVITALFAAITDRLVKDQLRDIFVSLMVLFGVATAICYVPIYNAYNTTVCPYCEEKINIDVKFCPECGFEQNEYQETEQKK